MTNQQVIQLTKLRPKGPLSAESALKAAGEGSIRETTLQIVQPSFSAEKVLGQSNPPRKPKNLDQRSREYLTLNEVNDLQAAAKKIGRYGHRDATLILITYRHGLRVGEAADLKWEQIDFNQGTIHVNRLKRGDASTHYLEGDEMRALRKLQRDYPDSRFVFCTERKGPMSTRTIRDVVARAGVVAGITFSVHPHMLRHGRGYLLAKKGTDTRAIQAYLGHRNITHTVIYTQLSADRFKGFGKD